MLLETERCPQCKEKPAPNFGRYIHIKTVIPIRKRIVFMITFDITVTLQYCPNCGFLKVQAG